MSVTPAFGDRLTLRVNGVQVASVSDPVLSSGGAGVFVGGDGNQVLLEQLKVWTWEPQAPMNAATGGYFDDGLDLSRRR